MRSCTLSQWRDLKIWSGSSNLASSGEPPASQNHFNHWKELHWLPIDASVKFKIATVTLRRGWQLLHILPACSTGTPHAEPYDPPQLICCHKSRDVTCHLVLVVSVQLLLPSGIVSQLTSVLLQLSQHSDGI